MSEAMMQARALRAEASAAAARRELFETIVEILMETDKDDRGVIEAVREVVEERDVAVARLSDLRAAATRFLDSLGEDEEEHPTLGKTFVSRSDEGAEDALRAALGMDVDD